METGDGGLAAAILAEGFMARYWAKVDRDPQRPDACWLWTGARSRKSHGDYGVIRAPGPSRLRLSAPRVALFLYTGDMGEGRDACHGDGCTSTLCVNPTHLYWGTHRQNILDNVRRHGRRANGHFGTRPEKAQGQGQGQGEKEGGSA